MLKQGTLGLVVMLALVLGIGTLAQAPAPFTSSMVGVNIGNRDATFAFAGVPSTGHEMLLDIQCSQNRAQLVTHAGEYAVQQVVVFPITCSPEPGYPSPVSIVAPPGSPEGSPPFTGTVTLQTEPLPAYPTQPAPPTTITLTVNAANWAYTCYYRHGCPAQGTASVTITGAF